VNPNKFNRILDASLRAVTYKDVYENLMTNLAGVFSRISSIPGGIISAPFCFIF
jgi:hypothetical protein